MSEPEIEVGEDGKPRCAWVGPQDPAMRVYHDEVWGTVTHDEAALFEALTLGIFQAGLNWLVILHKRDAFARAFHDFDPARVAAMDDGDVATLLDDASIIRNHAKIAATVHNARVAREPGHGLAELTAPHAAPPRTAQQRPRRFADLPTQSPESVALTATLKAAGYKFVGPTSMYAFMQTVGLVDDHLAGCFRAPPAAP